MEIKSIEVPCFTNMSKNIIAYQWKDTHYYVDEEGGVHHLYSKGAIRRLKPYYKKNAKGKKKWVVHLTIDGKRKEVLVSRMVWEVFKGEIPEGYFVVHINGASTMNDLYNLKLVSRKDLGKQYGGFAGRLIINLDTGDVYRGTRRAGKALYCSRTTISDICNGKCKNPIVNVAWYERTDRIHKKGG